MGGDEGTMKRVLLFLVGCMGARVALAYAAFRLRASRAAMAAMAAAAAAVALGFLAIYALRLRRTGPEVFGGRIWWDALRPVHAALYLLFAVMALRAPRHAWAALAADAALGLAAFAAHRAGWAFRG